MFTSSQQSNNFSTSTKYGNVGDTACQLFLEKPSVGALGDISLASVRKELTHARRKLERLYKEDTEKEKEEKNLLLVKTFGAQEPRPPFSPSKIHHVGGGGVPLVQSHHLVPIVHVTASQMLNALRDQMRHLLTEEEQMVMDKSAIMLSQQPQKQQIGYRRAVANDVSHFSLIPLKPLLPMSSSSFAPPPHYSHNSTPAPCRRLHNFESNRRFQQQFRQPASLPCQETRCLSLPPIQHAATMIIDSAHRFSLPLPVPIRRSENLAEEVIPKAEVQENATFSEDQLPFHTEQNKPSANLESPLKASLVSAKKCSPESPASLQATTDASHSITPPEHRQARKKFIQANDMRTRKQNKSGTQTANNEKESDENLLIQLKWADATWASDAVLWSQPLHSVEEGTILLRRRSKPANSTEDIPSVIREEVWARHDLEKK